MTMPVEPSSGDPAKAYCMCGDPDVARLADLVAWCGDQPSASRAMWSWDREQVASWLDAPE